MINYLGKDVIKISDYEYIEINSNEKNNIFWKEVYFISQNEKKFIGSYFTNRDVIDYNNYYVAILAPEYDENNTPMLKVKKIFDIQNREFIMGTNEELLEYYNENFLNKRAVQIL